MVTHCLGNGRWTRICAAAALAVVGLTGVITGWGADQAEPPVSREADLFRLPRFVSYTDVRIGDPAVSYKDQEFLPDARLMVWQDERERVWVCRFDPVTGDLEPADGRGRFIGVAAPLLTPDLFLKSTINGPEFGYSRRGIG